VPRLKGLVTMMAAGSLVLGGAATLGIGTANATATGCTRSVLVDQNGTTYGFREICSGGTGQYRVYATCTDELRGSGGTYYGSWVSPRHYSTVVCPYAGGVYWVGSNPHTQYRG